jgi:hypothetical protein
LSGVLALRQTEAILDVAVIASERYANDHASSRFREATDSVGPIVGERLNAFVIERNSLFAASSLRGISRRKLTALLIANLKLLEDHDAVIDAMKSSGPGTCGAAADDGRRQP